VVVRGIVEREGCIVMCADRHIWLEEELHDGTRGTGGREGKCLQDFIRKHGDVR
jgi:hypothetical protein